MYFSITKYHVYNIFTSKNVIFTVFWYRKISCLQYFLRHKNILYFSIEKVFTKCHVYNIFSIAKIYCMQYFYLKKILYTMFSYHKNIMYYSIFTSQKYHPARPFILHHRLTQSLASASFCLNCTPCQGHFLICYRELMFFPPFINNPF